MESMSLNHLRTFFILWLCFAAVCLANPYRLDDHLEVPDWLKLSGHQRTRYEGLDGQFRAGRTDDISMFAFRTDLLLTTQGDEGGFRAELMDSRQEGLDGDNQIGTSIVNAMELIQAHAYFDLGLGQGGELKMGRYTVDLTTRRFVARNRYRNTVNNFNGVHADWKTQSGDRVQLFYNLPIQRRVTERQALLDNRIRIDDESVNVQFWGAHIQTPDWKGRTNRDLFIFGLHENDSKRLNTANRQLFTGGARFYQSPEAGRFDFEVEGAIQWGESRASRSSSDVTDLDHRAGFLHLEAGYTFESEANTRMAFQFDYASGDRDPTDNENNGYDTLFGARRFDYGPTGTYGTLARSNLISPAYRITFNLAQDVSVMIAHRFNWLASDQDSWSPGRLRDATGESGSYLGHQPEIRIRWEALPGNLRVEGGVVRFFTSTFLEEAPGSPLTGDSTYGYLQTIFTF